MPVNDKTAHNTKKQDKHDQDKHHKDKHDKDKHDKKAPKKAAKKAPSHGNPHKDARRTFEHLGRVQALSSLTRDESESLSFLTKSADAAYRSERYKESADLLRAAEHLSFATIYGNSDQHVGDPLKGALQAEFDDLLERAEDHARRHTAPDGVRELRERLTKDARAALKHGAFRSALELARGAEALAHVDKAEGAALPAPSKQKQLKD